MEERQLLLEKPRRAVWDWPLVAAAEPAGLRGRVRDGCGAHGLSGYRPGPAGAHGGPALVQELRPRWPELGQETPASEWGGGVNGG